MCFGKKCSVGNKPIGKFVPNRRLYSLRTDLPINAPHVWLLFGFVALRKTATEKMSHEILCIAALQWTHSRFVFILSAIPTRMLFLFIVWLHSQRMIKAIWMNLNFRGSAAILLAVDVHFECS